MQWALSANTLIWLYLDPIQTFLPLQLHSDTLHSIPILENMTKCCAAAPVYTKLVAGYDLWQNYMTVMAEESLGETACFLVDHYTNWAGGSM